MNHEIERGAKLSDLKDYIVALPIAASVLAIAWEVGSFWPIGHESFSFFSLSEHLTFAVSAIPNALILLAGGAGGVLVATTIDRARRNSSQKSEGRDASRETGVKNPRRWIQICGVILLVLCVIVAWTHRSAVIACVSLAVVSIVADLPGKLAALGTRAHLVAATLFFPVLSLSFGIDVTRSRIKNAESNLSTIHHEDGASQRVILRSGERGVLSFDPREKRFMLEKWDHIQTIDWVRQPMQLPLSQSPGKLTKPQ